MTTDSTPTFSRRAALLGGIGVGTTALAAGTLASPAVAAPPAPRAHGGAGTGSAVHHEPGRLFPTLDRVRSIRVADMSDLDGFDRLLLVTLKGVVNRSRPEIYLIVDPVDATWVDDLPVRVQREKDPWKLLDRYRRCIAGAIVYDIDAPDTINLATTLAAQRGCVVASADQAAQHGLKIVEDLRGRFADDPAAIYEYAIDELWAGTRHEMLVGLPPIHTVEVEGVTWTEVLRAEQPVRDSSNRGTYTVDLSSHVGAGTVFVQLADAFPKDGWGPALHHVSVEVDGAAGPAFTPGGEEEAPYLFDAGGSQTAEGKRFADGGATFIYRFEVPAGTTSLTLALELENEYLVSVTDTAPTRVEPFTSFRDYAIATNSLVTWLPPSGDSGSQFEELLSRMEPGSVYAGWFSDDVDGEWSGVGLCSQHGVIVVAADYYTNASVLSGIRAETAASPAAPTGRAPQAGRTYVTLTFGEGDNIQYCQRQMRELWDDEARGSVPMNWTITPLLEDVGPALLHHFQATATELDGFVCGPSGAGYTYGDSWPQDEFARFTELSGAYQARTGLDIIYAYSTPTAEQPFPRLPDWVLQDYRDDVPLRGIIQTDEKASISEPGAIVPLIGTLYPSGGVEEYHTAITDRIAAHEGDAPLFLAGLINAWSWTPTDVRDLVDSLPEDVEVVLADEFFDLFAQTA